MGSNDKAQKSKDPKDDCEPEERDDRPKSVKQQSADLEKVTDYVEELDIDAVDRINLDAINQIEAQRNTEAQAREEELAKVKITKNDLDLLVQEFELSKQQAELALRKNRGDVVQAMQSLLN